MKGGSEDSENPAAHFVGSIRNKIVIFSQVAEQVLAVGAFILARYSKDIFAESRFQRKDDREIGSKNDSGIDSYNCFWEPPYQNGIFLFISCWETTNIHDDDDTNWFVVFEPEFFRASRKAR